MIKNERQTQILEILKKQSFATVEELAHLIYASPPTVRRDLSQLSAEGYIKRCHGGAMLLDENTKPPVYFRKEYNTREKVNMSRVAASLIPEGSTVFIDSSTSAFYVADFITSDSALTVITNGLPLAERLADTDINVYSTGGRLLKESHAFVGRRAEEAVLAYNADILFFSVASLSSDGILSDWSEEEAMMRTAMARGASLRVLLCDSSKFDTVSTFKLFSLSNIDYFVTDTEASESLINAYKLELLISSPAYLYRVSKQI